MTMRVVRMNRPPPGVTETGIGMMAIDEDGPPAAGFD
jgi:hypothetical protein